MSARTTCQSAAGVSGPGLLLLPSPLATTTTSNSSRGPLPAFHRVDSNEIAERRLAGASRKRSRRSSGINTQAVQALAANLNSTCTVSGRATRRVRKNREAFKKQRSINIITKSKPCVSFRDEQLCDIIPASSHEDDVISSTSSTTTTPTPPNSNMNKEDIWYTKSDYQEFRDSVKRDVLHMASMCQSNCLDNLDFSEHSVVGIEKYCCSASEQRTQKSQREQLIQAVLNQQATQKLLKMQDDDTIRLICQVYTQTAITSAQQRAKSFHH